MIIQSCTNTSWKLSFIAFELLNTLRRCFSQNDLWKLSLRIINGKNTDHSFVAELCGRMMSCRTSSREAQRRRGECEREGERREREKKWEREDEMWRKEWGENWKRGWGTRLVVKWGQIGGACYSHVKWVWFNLKGTTTTQWIRKINGSPIK